MSELYLDESTILLDLEGQTKEDILTAMGNNLLEKGFVKDSFVDAIIAREAEFATGLPTNGASVAIPHTDAEHVNKKTISFAVLKNPVDFGIMGDTDVTTRVKLVFMLAMDQADSQLSLLQRLMKVFQDDQTLEYLINEKSKTNIKHSLVRQLHFAFEGGE